MRAWMVVLAIFLVAATTEAQVRSARPAVRGQEVFRGVNPGFRPSAVRAPFRSFPRQSFVVAPQVPFYPYYPYSYYGSPYYPDSGYVTQDQSANIEQINSLNDQIQRLTLEVQQLQDELAATRAQPIQPSPLQANPATPPPPIVPTVLVFKDGHRTEIQGYAIIGPTLWTTYQDGFKKIALSDLNLDATRQENLKRGIAFLPER